MEDSAELETKKYMKRNKQEKQTMLTKKAVVCIGAMFCCILWGSAVPSIKIGYDLFHIGQSDFASQILFAGIRFALAGVLTIIFGSVINKRVLVPKRGSSGYIFTLSMFQTVLQYIPFYIGVANSTGVKSAIVLGVGVFVTIFVSCVLFRSERLTKSKVIGSFIGIVGIVIVNLSGGSAGLTAFSFRGDGLIILSTISYALSSSYLKKFSEKENPITLSGYQFFVGGVIMALFGMAVGGNITVFTLKGGLILAYLAFISAAAYTVWGILLKYNPVSRVAVYGFMNPLFGVILSAMFLGESTVLGWSYVVALVSVCTGIFIVNKK